MSIDEDYAICSWFLLNSGRLLLPFLILIILTLKYFSLFPYFLIIILFDFCMICVCGLKLTHYLKKNGIFIAFLWLQNGIFITFLRLQYYSVFIELCLKKKKLITISQYIKLCFYFYFYNFCAIWEYSLIFFDYNITVHRTLEDRILSLCLSLFF